MWVGSQDIPGSNGELVPNPKTRTDSERAMTDAFTTASGLRVTRTNARAAMVERDGVLK